MLLFVKPSGGGGSIPTQNLLAFWNLSNLTDASGNGNTLINNGGVQFVSGKVGNCASFNGSNKALRLDSFSSSFSSGSPFTISLWYNITNRKDYFTLIGCSQGSTLNVHGFSNGDLAVNNSASADASISGFFTENSWTHFAVARTSTGNLKIWKNGTIAYNSVAKVSYGNVPFIEIGNLSSYGTTFALDGKIDSVGIWQRELTQSEIDTLYNSGNGLEP